MTVAINFYAHFVASAVGATGLTVTVDLDSIAKADGARGAVVTGGSAVEGIDGYYHYRYATADLDTYDYICIFKTTGTADQKQIPSLWANYGIGESARISATAPASTALTNATWTDAKAAFVDVAISSRNATAPPTAAANADAVLDELLSGHTIPGSAGVALTNAGSAADPLLNAVPGSYASGTAGAVLGALSAKVVVLSSPVGARSDLSLVKGCDYYAADGNSLDFILSGFPALTDGSDTVMFYGRMENETNALLTVEGTVAATNKARIELSHANLDTLGAGKGHHIVLCTWAATGHTTPLVQGTIQIDDPVRE